MLDYIHAKFQGRSTFSNPVAVSLFNVKIKLYLLYHAFIKQCLKNWKFKYRENILIYLSIINLSTSPIKKQYNSQNFLASSFLIYCPETFSRKVVATP